MKIKSLFVLLIAFMFVGFNSNSQVGSWEKLGSRVVNYKLERDVIHVGLKDGGFRKLKVVVTHGALNMHKMIIEYGNGSKEEIALRHRFLKGSTSRVIDIKGHKRIIKNIVFVYDTKNLARGKAVVTVFGLH